MDRDAARRRMREVIGQVETALIELYPAAQKSISEAVGEYENVLTRYAYDVLTGRMDAIDFRRAHKALIKSSALNVFEQGWIEGGGDPKDTEPDDIALYKDWASEQTGFVNDFAAWLASTDENGKRNWEMKRRALADRLAAWALAARNLGEQAAARAKGDPYLTFSGDDGEESCDECQEYKGQRHRLSWWDKRGLLKRNGNDNYGCGRWEPCHHHFFYDDGRLAVQ